MVDRRKQNKTKKSTHRLLGMPAYNKCLKFQGKIVIPTLDGAPGSIRFLDKRHYLLSFAKSRSLSKIIHQYFSMQNQYNQIITKFVLKSSIQDIHKP